MVRYSLIFVERGLLGIVSFLGRLWRGWEVGVRFGFF